MASTSWKEAGAAANADDGGAVAWTDPANAIADNTDNATAALSPGASQSQVLRLTDFGFTTSDIPLGSVIDGIEVEVRRYVTNQNVGNNARDKDSTIILRKTGGTVGTAQAVVGSSWPDSAGVQTYGGASDLWGTTGLTLEGDDIRSEDFGIDIGAQRQNGSPIAAFQYVRMRVHYSDVTLDAELDASEAPDIAAVAVGFVTWPNFVGARMAALGEFALGQGSQTFPPARSESPDIADFNIELVALVQIAATEQPDIVEIAAPTADVMLAATEQPDTAQGRLYVEFLNAGPNRILVPRDVFPNRNAPPQCLADGSGSCRPTSAPNCELQRMSFTDFGTRFKQPEDRLDYDVDFSRWLADYNDTITSAAVSISDGGVSLDSYNFTETVVKSWLSGGVHGETVTVTVDIVTAGGREKQVCFRVRIKDHC